MITTQSGGVAGSSYSISYLARGLREKGHKVILGIPHKTLLHELALDHGIETCEISFRRKIHLKSCRQINQIVRRHNIDIINPQESKDRYNTILSKVLFRFPAKIVLTRRQRVADNNFIKRWLHVRFSEKIVVVSKGLQELVKRKGFPIEHTAVIHNGIPTEEYVLQKNKIEALRGEYGYGKDDVVIGCVARLKRQDQLIEAFKILPDSWKLLLVGIERTQFHKKYPKVTLDTISDRIIFTGIIRNKSGVYHHYPLMTTNVLPSQMDGFGLTLVEAMAMGVPVIGSNYGGIPDVIEHGISGFIFENDQVEELAGYIKEIVFNEELRKKFINNGYDIALNKFAISSTIEKYEKLFLQIAGT